MMSYFAKLTGEDLLRYLNEMEKNYYWRQIGDLTESAAKCLHFLSLHHDGRNSWCG